MKQVKYFCDICNKEIQNHKDDDCVSINIFKAHDWTIDVPVALQMKNLHVCGVCGKKVNDYIESLITEAKS